MILVTLYRSCAYSPEVILTYVGIGALILGGGSGWLTAQHGHTIDNPPSARVVLANGTIVTVPEGENPDFFWGITGGGSNFGVCTVFTNRAHLQGPVLS